MNQDNVCASNAPLKKRQTKCYRDLSYHRAQVRSLENGVVNPMIQKRVQTKKTGMSNGNYLYRLAQGEDFTLFVKKLRGRRVDSKQFLISEHLSSIPVSEEEVCASTSEDV